MSRRDFFLGHDFEFHVSVCHGWCADAEDFTSLQIAIVSDFM